MDTVVDSSVTFNSIETDAAEVVACGGGGVSRGDEGDCLAGASVEVFSD
jgi:hypothetical protein